MEIIGWVGLGVVLCLLGGLVAWWVWARRHPFDYRTPQGVRVYGAHGGPAAGMVWVLLDRVIRGLDPILGTYGVATPKFDLSRVWIIWRQTTPCSRDAEGIPQPDPRGGLLYYEDPRGRRPGRGHDWYAGRRWGNTLEVGWPQGGALAHELAHLLLEQNGLNADAEHIRYLRVWRFVDGLRL